jgi:hypothetical protein
VQERGLCRMLGAGPHARAGAAGAPLQLLAQVFRPVVFRADPEPSLASVYLADPRDGSYRISRWDDLVLLDRGVTPIAHAPADSWRPHARGSGSSDRSGVVRAEWLSGEPLFDLQYGPDGHVVSAIEPSGGTLVELDPTGPPISGFHERSRGIRVLRREHALLAAYFVLGTLQHKQLANGASASLPPR